MMQACPLRPLNLQGSSAPLPPSTYTTSPLLRSDLHEPAPPGFEERVAVRGRGAHRRSLLLRRRGAVLHRRPPPQPRPLRPTLRPGHRGGIPRGRGRGGGRHRLLGQGGRGAGQGEALGGASGLGRVDGLQAGGLLLLPPCAPGQCGAIGIAAGRGVATQGRKDARYRFVTSASSCRSSPCAAPADCERPSPRRGLASILIIASRRLSRHDVWSPPATLSLQYVLASRLLPLFLQLKRGRRGLCSWGKSGIKEMTRRQEGGRVVYLVAASARLPLGEQL